MKYIKLQERTSLKEVLFLYLHFFMFSLKIFIYYDIILFKKEVNKMVDYIKAMELIEMTARGNNIGVVSYITTAGMLFGAVFVMFLISQVENLIDRGKFEKRKRMAFFAMLGVACLVFVHFIERNNPPNYTRNEVRKVARTFGVENPQNLKVNIEYLRTVAPAYVSASTNENKDNDEWVSDVLTKFYNNRKPESEYEKLFENLKK